jgi:hypothetical protein
MEDMVDTVVTVVMVEVTVEVTVGDTRVIHLLMVNLPLSFHRRPGGGTGPGITVMVDSWDISEDVGGRANKV